MTPDDLAKRTLATWWLVQRCWAAHPTETHEQISAGRLDGSLLMATLIYMIFFPLSRTAPLSKVIQSVVQKQPSSEILRVWGHETSRVTQLTRNPLDSSIVTKGQSPALLITSRSGRCERKGQLGPAASGKLTPSWNYHRRTRRSL